MAHDCQVLCFRPVLAIEIATNSGTNGVFISF